MKYMIDLFGLPGSGKTTIATEVANYLKNKNVNVYKLNGRPWGDSGKNTFIHKIRILLLSMKYKYIKVFLKNFSFLCKNNILGKESFRQNIKIILYFGELENAFKSGNGIYISDNGLFQTFVSMIFTDKYEMISFNDIDKMLSLYKKIPIISKINFFYVECDYVKSYNRIVQRGKDVRSKMNDECSSKRILKWQEDVFNLFLKKLDNIDQIDDSKKIIHFLEKL